MTRNELLRSMLRALADVEESGNTFAMSDGWEVTVHANRQGAGFSVPHVVKITLHPEYVVLETSKNHRYVMVDEDIRAIAQEPSLTERRGRKTGF